MVTSHTYDQLLEHHARATAAREAAADELRETDPRSADYDRQARLVASLAADVRDIGARMLEALPDAPRPTFTPSQDLLASGPTVALKASDIGSRVPDPMIGARHNVKTGRNKKGATRKVTHRGRATVQGATEWDRDQLARFAGDRAAAVVDILASDRLSHVRRLTLGSDAVDVTRAADAILAALDVPTLIGTDAESWQRIDGIDRVDTDGMDAMSTAILAGEALTTLVSLSRHRSGIAGYLGTTPDVSHVTTPNAGRKRGADSPWQDHGIDPRQLVPRGGIDIADLADVTAPTHTLAPWPTLGPRSTRPVTPQWRASERDAVDAVRDADDRPIYWHAADDPSRIVGRALKPRTKRERPTCEHPTDAPCETCEHIARHDAACERVHIGNVTTDRGPRAGQGSARPTTTAQRQAASDAARERVDAVPTVEVSTAAAVAILLDALEPGDAVRMVKGSTVAYVKRTAGDGRYRPRVDAVRLPDARTATRAADVVSIALDI